VVLLTSLPGGMGPSFKLGGEDAGIEEILDRHADLAIARSIYRTRRRGVSWSANYAV
jgi:hypothetical protein